MFCLSTRHRGFRPELHLFSRAIPLAALLALAAGHASAQVTADTVILGVATMDYADGSGTNAFRATASSTITIQLVESQLTISGLPTAAAPGDTAALPADQAGSSGNTLNYRYALTANANGDDIYDLDVSITTATDVSGETVTWNLLAADGATPIGGADPATVALGSAIVAAVPAANTLQFPGGTLTEFAAGELIVFEGTDYLIASVAPGTAASHSNAGGIPHGDEGTTVAEVPAQIVLAANPAGANVAPAFTAASVGAIAREQIFVSISVTATATKKNKDGIVDFDMTTNPDGDPSLTAGAAGVESRFSSVAVAVQKDARNVTTGGSFAGTASGAPGDVVEYRVTVSNSGSNAKNVIVTDQVPPYTTLVADAFGATLFAQAIRDGGTPVLLTTTADDDEDAAVASGNAAGSAAGSALNFYVGPSNKDSTDKGGDVANGSAIEIFYQVTID